MSLFNDVADVSQTGDLWCRKRLLNQLSHRQFLIFMSPFLFRCKCGKRVMKLKPGLQEVIF